MGKRQEAALITKQKIIEATKALLEVKSVDDINIEEITNKAGVAKGSFYTYFKRKEDVVSVIAFMDYEIIRDIVMVSTDSIYEQICVYLKKSVQVIEDKSLQVAQLWMKSVVAPIEGETAGIMKYQYDMDTIGEILLRAVDHGELKKDTPVDEIKSNIVNTYYGAVVSWCIMSGEKWKLIKSIDDFCKDALRVIIEEYVCHE